jgi:hypothetical protein
MSPCLGVITSTLGAVTELLGAMMYGTAQVSWLPALPSALTLTVQLVVCTAATNSADLGVKLTLMSHFGLFLQYDNWMLPSASTEQLANCDISVGIATQLWAGWPRSLGFPFPAGSRDCCVLHNFEAGYGAHPASCTIVTGDKEAGEWSWQLTPSSAEELYRVLILFIRSTEYVIVKHCVISRQIEGNLFGDYLISGSVSVTTSNVIEASIVLCFVSLWLVWVNVRSACALNTRYIHYSECLHDVALH